MADASTLLGAMPKAGAGVRFGSLSPEGKTAVKANLKRFGFLADNVKDDTVVALFASPVFEVTVDGTTRRLGFGINQGSGRSYPTQDMFEGPSISAPGAIGNGGTRFRAAPPETLGIVMPYGNRQIQDQMELFGASFEVVGDLAKSEAARLQRSQAEWLKSIFVANAGMAEGLPQVGRMDDLTPEVRARLKDNFISSFRSFGYDSESSAENAWTTAKFARSYMDIGLTFLAQREYGSSLTMLIIGNTKIGP